MTSVGRGKLPHHRSGGVRIEPDFARVDFANALDDQFRSCLLQDDARAAELHRLDELVLILGSGQNDNLALCVRSAEAPAGLRDRPCTASGGRESRRPGVVSWTTCTTSRPSDASPTTSMSSSSIQQLSKTVTDDRMIVSQHYSDGLRLKLRSHCRSRLVYDSPGFILSKF